MLLNAAMNTIDDLRRKNLAILASEMGGVGLLAEKIDRSSSQVSQWATGARHSVSGKPRRLSSDSARYIETMCGKPAGWMDVDHSENASSYSTEQSATHVNAVAQAHPTYINIKIDDEEDADFVLIKRLTLRLSAGIARVSTDQAEEYGSPVPYQRSELERRGLFAEDLLAIEVKGDSMTPNIKAGDTVIINTADKVPKDGRAFAINYDGEPTVKRMKWKRREWFLASDNEDKSEFPDEQCKDTNCIVIGIVVDLIRKTSNI